MSVFNSVVPAHYHSMLFKYCTWPTTWSSRNERRSKSWKEPQGSKHWEHSKNCTSMLSFVSGIKISLKSTMKTVSELPRCSMTLILHVPNIFHRHSPKKGSWPCWCEIIYSALLTGFSSSVSPCTLHILPDTLYSHFNTLVSNLE